MSEFEGETKENSVQITLTYQDIEKGVRKDPTQCPIALAIHRETGHQARVEPHEIYFRHQAWQISPKVLAWVRRFDQGGEVWPMKLVMEGRDIRKEGEQFWDEL